MSGINLWLLLIDGNGDIGVPGTDYDDGGSWTFYQNGLGGTGTPIFFPEDISNDGITQSDFTQDSVFVYCIDNNTTFAPEFQSGNGITDSGATYDSNNSNNTAVFYNRLPKNTDGYIEFEFDSTNSQQYRFYLGLGNNTDNATNDLNYSILLQDAEFVRVYENGSAVSGKSLVPGVQTFKIEVIEGEVKYYHNNVVFYTSTINVTSDLYPKIFCDNNSARYEYSSFVADFRSQEGQYVPLQEIPLVWNQPTANTTLSNNNRTIQKTSGGNSYNSHAGLYNVVPAGEDGFIETTLTQINKHKRIGFHKTVNGSNYAPHYTILFQTNNKVYAATGQTLSLINGGHSVGQTWRLAIENNKLNVYKDGVFVKTFTNYAYGRPDNNDFYGTTMFFSRDSRFDQIQISHDENGDRLEIDSCSGDCITIPVNLTNCDDTTGQNPCTDCQISILNFSAVCNGGLTLDVCIDYQANECTFPAADGNGWTVGYALYNNGVNTQIGQSHTGTGFQINNTGAITQICFTIPMVQQNDQINITFTDANTGNDSRGCLVKGTGIKKYPLQQPFHPTNGTNC